MKKNGILTLLFACIPGAGQMYQGYMKRGLSLITMFCLFIIVGSATGLDALEGAPPGLEPEQQVLDTLGAEELTRMILDLREPYKTPCRLVLLEQHTMAEAARLCGRPEKTVNAQIYRAKKMLVQQIREQQEGRSVHGTV